MESREGAELVKIGKFYNDALLCPEINNMGAATLSEIKRQNYPKIFFKEVYDEIAMKRTVKLGWRTTAQNKLLMLSEFKAAFRNQLLNIKDIELLKEMTTVAFETSSKVELNGKDLTVAACLAVQAIAQAPHKNIYKAKNPKNNPLKAFEELTKEPKGVTTYYS